MRAYRKEWDAAHKDKISKMNRDQLLRRRGLTQEAFDKMVADQEGACALCRAVVAKLYIDHDHVTNQTRGLLCNHCNLGLGHFKDDPQVLEKAAVYLLRRQS